MKKIIYFAPILLLLIPMVSADLSITETYIDQFDDGEYTSSLSWLVSPVSPLDGKKMDVYCDFTLVTGNELRAISWYNDHWFVLDVDDGGADEEYLVHKFNSDCTLDTTYNVTSQILGYGSFYTMGIDSSNIWLGDNKGNGGGDPSRIYKFTHALSYVENSTVRQCNNWIGALASDGSNVYVVCRNNTVNYYDTSTYARAGTFNSQTGDTPKEANFDGKHILIMDDDEEVTRFSRTGIKLPDEYNILEFKTGQWYGFSSNDTHCVSCYSNGSCHFRYYNRTAPVYIVDGILKNNQSDLVYLNYTDSKSMHYLNITFNYNYTESTDSTNYLRVKFFNSTDNYYLQVDNIASAHNYYFYKDSQICSNSSSYYMDPGIWHRINIVFDLVSNTLDAYVDGNHVLDCTDSSYDVFKWISIGFDEHTNYDHHDFYVDNITLNYVYNYSSICDADNVGNTICGGSLMSSVVTCEQLARNVYQWSTEDMEYCEFGCYHGYCLGKSNKTQCKDQCNINETICMGEYVISCGVGSYGCEEWKDENKTYCKRGCSEGKCIPEENFCSIGDLRCKGNKVQNCSQSGTNTVWRTIKSCEFGCNISYSAGDVNNVTCSETGHAHHAANSFKEIFAFASYILDPFLAGSYIIIALIISIFAGMKFSSSNISIFSFVLLIIAGTVYSVVPLLVGMLITIIAMLTYGVKMKV